MGVFVDYALLAEGTEEEVSGRLERVRQRCLDLPLKGVGVVRRVAPVYNPIVIDLFEMGGYALPEAIAERLRQVEADPKRREFALTFSAMIISKLSKRELTRYLAPALELIEHTDLWKEEDLPEQVAMETPFDFSPLTIYRKGIVLEFANVLLRYGYVLLLDPGEGCETVSLALSTYGKRTSARARKPALWYGEGMTKTQYARNFIQAHETVCRVLDIVQEEGLLHLGSDTCGYYASRKWKDASRIVNEELAFARAVGDIFDLEIGNLREEGAQITVVVDNASRAKQVDFSETLARETETDSAP